MTKPFFSLKENGPLEPNIRAASVIDEISNGVVTEVNFLQIGFSDLANIVASGSKLTEMQASHVDFLSCKFDSFDMSESNFDECHLKWCDFRLSDFVQVNFYNCKISNVEFERCNFSRCSFFDCFFDEVIFNECDLVTTHFGGCNFKNTNLNMSDLSLQGTEFVRCTIKNS